MSKKKDNNLPLISRIEITNTPFVAVQIAKEEIILTMGKYKMTNKTFKTIEEVEEHLKNEKWDLIATFVSIVTENVINEINNKLNQK